MKKSIFTIFPIALLASCSSELMETAGNSVNGSDVEKVSIVSHPFVFDDDTRTSLTATENSISFAWADYDALGVFPIAPTTNNQARQALSVPADCETDAHYASFDGAGWELKKGNTYAAYCPYNGSLPAETPYTEVPIDITGQDGTLETIGKKYDYMYAPSSFAEEKVNGHTHEVVFDFQHAIAILQLKLTMPVAATWKSLTISREGLCTTSATMNVQDGSITSWIESPDITLTLNNVTTTASNKEVTLYVAVLPTTLDRLSLTATTSDNKSYCASYYFTWFENQIKRDYKTLEAGKAYRITTSFNVTPILSGDGYENGYAYVDLNLPSRLKWATMNVGAKCAISYGKFYAWGETKAYYEKDYSNARNYSYAGNYTKTYYYWNTYKLSNDDDGNSFRKYTTSTETTLDPEDDAATQNWGDAWRMPNHAEQEELVNNCYWVWTNGYNGSARYGYIVYAAKSPLDKGQVVCKGDIPSSNYSLSDPHIFFPMTGIVAYDDWQYVFSGEYWSSSLDEDESKSAWYMRILNKYDYVDSKRLSSEWRCGGFSVRAVCEK